MVSRIVSALVLASVTAFASPALADEPVVKEEPSEKIVSGGYGAPEVRMTSLAGSAAVLVGSQGGWIINHHFIFGGAGYGLVNDVSLMRGVERKVSLGYGGFRPGFIIGGKSDTFHFTGGVLLGAAGVGLGDASGTTFVAEPDLGVDVSVVRWLRIGASASYRFALPSGDGLTRLAFEDVSGPSAGINLNFGSF